MRRGNFLGGSGNVIWKWEGNGNEIQQSWEWEGTGIKNSFPNTSISVCRI